MLSILVLFSLIFQCLISLGLVVNYKVNKEKITALFCVNKAKPQLKCNGLCHLAKQLKNTDSDHDKSATSGKGQKTKVEIPAFVPGRMLLYSANCVAITSFSSVLGDWNNHYSFQYLTAVFHPPLSLQNISLG